MALLGRFLFETHDAVRLRKQHYDTSYLEIFSDIPYMEDGDDGHLFDIYRPKGAAADIPVIVNIHGGGTVPVFDTFRNFDNGAGKELYGRFAPFLVPVALFRLAASRGVLPQG